MFQSPETPHEKKKQKFHVFVAIIQIYAKYFRFLIRNVLKKKGKKKFFFFLHKNVVNENDNNICVRARLFNSMNERIMNRWFELNDRLYLFAMIVGWLNLLLLHTRSLNSTLFYIHVSLLRLVVDSFLFFFYSNNERNNKIKANERKKQKKHTLFGLWCVASVLATLY